MATIISLLWPIAMLVVAWVIYRRISSDQPREVVAPFALTFAWILVAPWMFAWYTALAWVTLTQVPRNRMTRWLAMVTVVLAIWHSSGRPAACRPGSELVAATPREGQLRRPAQPGTDRPTTASVAVPRLSGWTASLRQHWLAVILVTLGVILRLMAQFAYRPALFYIDSVKYLYDSQGNDPEGYKGPLRAILSVANLNTVAAVQHLIGIVIAVVIYRLLLRRGVSRWLAALAMAPVLLDAYQLQQEQAIMPTTLLRSAARGRLRRPALAAEDHLAGGTWRPAHPRHRRHRVAGRGGPDRARGRLPAGGAYRAIDASRATAWRTDWYTTARFGNLYPGTGLLLDMGHPVTITGVPDQPRQRPGRRAPDPGRRRPRAGAAAARRAGGRRGRRAAPAVQPPGARPLCAPVVHPAAGGPGRHLPGERV